MEKITYGTPRLVDWVAQIRAGAATVRVHFTGGALTTYGVTPAEFTTSNLFIQRVIENSTYFKEGRIIVLRRMEIEEPKKPLSKESAKPQAAPQMETAESPAQHGMQESSETETSEIPVGFTKVEVSCLPDAQAYLQENFNISSYKVRSYESAQKIAAEHGVLFTGAKFDTLNGIKKTDSENQEEE